VNDSTNQLFAGNVFGVGLTGNHKLHPATIAIALQNFANAFHIVEEQGGSFVGGESSGKANGQHKGI
jgi:hypothetical protein